MYLRGKRWAYSSNKGLEMRTIQARGNEKELTSFADLGDTPKILHQGFQQSLALPWLLSKQKSNPALFYTVYPKALYHHANISEITKIAVTLFQFLRIPKQRISIQGSAQLSWQRTRNQVTK
ncbi:hypothetical protein KIL84_001162 [Mauremys mutica]|uniref:Uncharacterized protein n=1 Tax=Mauremys mutica TaxID=74926 RepID=A0A9D3WZX3_9SAUR|nr:hypothetical protein KIL84_001162 [Mauremys mutica]